MYPEKALCLCWSCEKANWESTWCLTSVQLKLCIQVVLKCNCGGACETALGSKPWHVPVRLSLWTLGGTGGKYNTALVTLIILRVYHCSFQNCITIKGVKAAWGSNSCSEPTDSGTVGDPRAAAPHGCVPWLQQLVQKRWQPQILGESVQQYLELAFTF